LVGKTYHVVRIKRSSWPSTTLFSGHAKTVTNNMHVISRLLPDGPVRESKSVLVSPLSGATQYTVYKFCNPVKIKTETQSKVF